MVLPTPAKDGPVASSITGALDVDQAVDAIQTKSFDVRDKLTAEIDQRLNSSSTRLDGLKAQTSGLTEEGKMQFNQASTDAEKRRADLQSSLTVARSATENAWEGARAQLAADYARYAEAVARAEIGLTKTLPPQKDTSK
jgi:predicted phage tail protein